MKQGRQIIISLDNIDWNHMNSGRGLNQELRQPPLNQMPFHQPPPNLPAESSQTFP